MKNKIIIYKLFRLIGTQEFIRTFKIKYFILNLLLYYILFRFLEIIIIHLLYIFDNAYKNKVAVKISTI